MPEVERTGTWQTRYWCPTAGTHQDLDLGAMCGWQDCGDPAVARNGYHNLCKRRMLICAECSQGYFTNVGFDEHECYSAY